MRARTARFGPWLGGAILLGLVTLMVGVAAVRGTLVAGSAVAPPVPAPPEPGHCLLQNPFDGELAGYVVYEDDSLPAGRAAPCDGARFGEVVSIGPGVDLETAFQDGSWERCWNDASEYLGLPDPAGVDGHRSTDVNVMASLTGPDERQRAAGQDWAACVVQLASSGTGTGLTVEHSLRGAWSRTEDRRLLAMCLNDVHLLYPTGCRDPHGAEQVSSWPGDLSGFGEPDADACRQDAEVALGSPAALDRGDLTALALPTRWSDRTGQQIIGPDAVVAGQPYFVTCLLVSADPSRALVGPLRELGDAPVPLR
jgi:hypothetical protein